MSAEKRIRQIIILFAVQIQDGKKRWLTPNEIAAKLDLSRSPHLQYLLKRMVADGVLTYREVEKSGRWPGYEYTLSPGTFTEPRKSRVIPIRIKGRQAGQMELFAHENA